MRNHLVRRPPSRDQGPVLLDHAPSDDSPLLVRLLPDAPLDHLIPLPANLSAVVEGVSVGALLPDECVIQDFLPNLWRQHLSIVILWFCTTSRLLNLSGFDLILIIFMNSGMNMNEFLFGMNKRIDNKEFDVDYVKLFGLR